MKALSSAQILERLGQRLPLLTGGARDLPERQRTLRATIEWSFELLTAEEQRLFARLSVFRGGCTVEAAEEVAEGDLDMLQSLVAKSLLRYTDERFWMLETIREYAAERLEKSGQAEGLKRRHAEHFLTLAEEAWPNLRGSPKEWLERLEREHDNLRAALDEFEEWGQGELALRLAGALSRFWVMRGHLAEGRRRLESALRADVRPTAARAKALNEAGLVSLEGGDPAAGRLWAEDGLALHQTFGDAWGTAHSRFLLGCADAIEGEFERGRQLFEEGVRAFRELGDEHYTLLSTRQLAWMHFELGDRERARALHEEVVHRARLLHNERMEATSLGALGEYAIYEGRLQVALPLLKESTRIYRDLGDRVSIAMNLCRFARALADEGSAETAARLLASSDALHEEAGASVASWIAEVNEGTLTQIRTQLDDAAFAEAWEQGRALTADEAVALALDALE